jgi:hypothetical protein
MEAVLVCGILIVPEIHFYGFPVNRLQHSIGHAMGVGVRDQTAKHSQQGTQQSCRDRQTDQKEDVLVGDPSALGTRRHGVHKQLGQV